MESGIYEITCITNGRSYIGSAVWLDKRKRHHFSQLRKGSHRNIHLQRAFDKYGEESFSYRILEHVADARELIACEQKWIDDGSFDRLFNICPTAGNSLGRIHSAETRKKISDNHADVSGEKNPMWRTKGPMSGKKHTEEAKKKMSEALKGKEPWCKGLKRPEHSKKMTGSNNPFYGKKHTEEGKQNIKDGIEQRLREKGGTKLTWEQVKEIRHRRANENVSVTALAKEYGVSRHTCSQIVNNKTWKINLDDAA